MLALCAACRGFLPPNESHCPHCNSRSPQPRHAKRKLAGVALGVATSMTLMACYGGPNVDVEGCSAFPTLSSGETLGKAAAYAGGAVSCGNGETNTRVFAAFPDEPGTLTLHWSGDVNLSVARWTCEDRVEIDCQGPSASGELSFKAYGPQALAIDGLSEADAETTKFWVTLVPSCGDGFTETFEQCDDGAREPGDGCDENCILEEPK